MVSKNPQQKEIANITNVSESMVGNWFFNNNHRKMIWHFVCPSLFSPFWSSHWTFKIIPFVTVQNEVENVLLFQDLRRELGLDIVKTQVFGMSWLGSAQVISKLSGRVISHPRGGGECFFELKSSIFGVGWYKKFRRD